MKLQNVLFYGFFFLLHQPSVKVWKNNSQTLYQYIAVQLAGLTYSIHKNLFILSRLTNIGLLLVMSISQLYHFAVLSGK